MGMAVGIVALTPDGAMVPALCLGYAELRALVAGFDRGKCQTFFGPQDGTPEDAPDIPLPEAMAQAVQKLVALTRPEERAEYERTLRRAIQRRLAAWRAEGRRHALTTAA